MFVFIILQPDLTVTVVRFCKAPPNATNFIDSPPVTKDSDSTVNHVEPASTSFGSLRASTRKSRKARRRLKFGCSSTPQKTKMIPWWVMQRRVSQMEISYKIIETKLDVILGKLNELTPASTSTTSSTTAPVMATTFVPPIHMTPSTSMTPAMIVHSTPLMSASNVPSIL